MYKITAYIHRTGTTVDMPHDKDLGLFEATHRMKLYKKRNPDLTYSLVNQDNGDIVVVNYAKRR